MASSRFTITCSAAIRRAPVERLTATMAGSSWGVRPTANASENRSDSTTGRFSTRLTAKMKVTRTTMARTSSSPKAVIPRSKRVVTSRVASSAATAPNSVDFPTLTTTAVPRPLTTWVPRNTALVRPAKGVTAGTVPAAFSLG